MGGEFRINGRILPLGFCSLAITAVVSAVPLGVACAQVQQPPAPVTISTDLNALYRFHLVDGTLIIEQGQPNSFILGVRATGNNQTVRNNGSIESPVNGIVFIGDNVALINNARVRGRLNGIFARQTISSLINRNAIEGTTVNGVRVLGTVGTLFNDVGGRISGRLNGVFARTITSLINHGSVEGATRNGVFTNEIVGTLINEAGARISGGVNGVRAGGGITNLINRGTIEGSLGNSFGVSAVGDIGTLINETGASIKGGLNGARATGGIANLINHGAIEGTAGNGVRAGGNIGALVNGSGGRISGGQNGVWATGGIASLINHGTIDGGTFGVNVFSTIGTLTNSGLIEGRTGIRVGRLSHDGLDRALAPINPQPLVGNVSITNSGTIRSTDGPAGFAIDLGGEGSDTITLLEGSVIEGRIRWDGAGDTLNWNYGGKSSAALVFDGLGRVPARFDANVTAGGKPVVQAYGESRAVVVIIDPTAFALADNILFDITSAISGAVTGQAAAWRATQSGGQIISPAADVIRTAPRSGRLPEPGGWFTRLWADLFGGVRDEEGDGALGDARHDFGGIVAGVETGTAGLRGGLFIGGSEGKADIEGGSQDIDITTVFGGPYFSAEGDGFAVDGMVTLGLSDHESKRSVNNNTVAGGREDAKADYDGFFVAPEITVSSSLGMVRPSLTLRYAGLFLDSYREKSPSGAGLNVDDRDIHQISARAQLGLPLKMDEDRLSTELRVGAEGRAHLGKSRVRGSVLGQGFAFDAGGGRRGSHRLWLVCSCLRRVVPVHAEWQRRGGLRHRLGRHGPGQYRRQTGILTASTCRSDRNPDRRPQTRIGQAPIQPVRVILSWQIAGCLTVGLPCIALDALDRMLTQY